MVSGIAQTIGGSGRSGPVEATHSNLYSAFQHAARQLVQFVPFWCSGASPGGGLRSTDLA